jgi:hypothetical protein
VRPVSGRKKKLVVAFHFQLGNKTAWTCDPCRKSGLEATRRCGWIPEAELTQARVVWARGQVTCEQCPVSYITPESQSLLEEFHVWKLFGHHDYYVLPARLVEAIVTLENELRTEIRNAQE